jgi:hypothetical protein
MCMELPREETHPDETFVKEHATGEPFYTAISYMNVSMECLIGAPYTRLVTQRGLAGPPRPSLGRVDAAFLDPGIGALSRQAQLWIDRNFAFDYTLKSLEKITVEASREALHQARVVIKHAAYDALVAMIDLLGPDASATPSAAQLGSLCDARFSALVSAMQPLIRPVADHLTAAQRQVLLGQYEQWSTSSGWIEINAADPCGT